MPPSTSTPFLTSRNSYDSLKKPSGKHARSFWTWATISRLQLELLLTIPPLCFLVFAGLTVRNSGRHVDEYPIPHLQKAATYGPTVFPIIFAAIAGNLFKSIASWRLEAKGGISVLNLEYLLSSRTVFSTVTTPFNLRRVTFMTPFIIGVWILSPLGGQAASRILRIAPSTTNTTVPFQYFEVHGLKNSSLIDDDVGRFNQTSEILYGLFVAALLTPGKIEPRDIFGHARIPMIETCKDSNSEGWHYLNPENECRYSSLFGLPIKGTNINTNSTLRIETSYAYTDCKTVQTTYADRQSAYSVVRHYIDIDPETNKSIPKYSWADMNSPNLSQANILLAIPSNGSDLYNPLPDNLLFGTFDVENLQSTNANCSLIMKDVEVDVACYGHTCTSKRIKYSKVSTERSGTGLFKRYWPDEPGRLAKLFWYHFLYSIARKANTDKSFPFVENYLMTSDASSYSLDQGNINSRRPVSINDEEYSQRFTQLVNTFWIAMHGGMALAGNFTSYYAPESVQGVWKEDDVRNIDSGAMRKEAMMALMQRQNIRNTTGDQVPDRLEMHYVLGWTVVLVISSTVMLLASIASAILGTLRQGPDLLDRTGVMLRDNAYVRIDDMHASSVEDGFDQARRLKNERLCIGDVKDKEDEDVGYIALGTLNAVTPMRRAPKGRLYQ